MYDHIIVGFGLSGAALAEELRQRGKKIVVIDRSAPVTSSRIAAGLITPVTGKRLAVKPDWHELWTGAIAFYSRASENTDETFLHRLPAVRIFRDEDERKRFFLRQEMLKDLVVEVDGAEPLTNYNAPFSAIEMPDSGRLDVVRFLDSLRERREINFVTADVSYDDIVVASEVVRIPKLDLEGARITFCEGYQSTRNPWFPDIKFEAAKGEIISIECHNLDEDRTIHSNGIWITRKIDSIYRVGATYDWDRLDCEPTPEAKQSLCDRLAKVLRLPFTVTDHHAAIRPVVYGRHPIIGLCREAPVVGLINGLGSKGSLLAPAVAQVLADAIENASEIDPKYCIYSRFGSTK